MFVNGCIPVIGFATNALAIASTCTTNPGDAGTPSANVQQFVIAGTTWTPTTIIPAALDTWSTDGDGTNATKVLTATGLVPAEAVYTLPAPSTPVPIDTKQIENGDWTFAYMNRAGTTVFYQSAGGLYTSSATASSVGTVQATGANFLRAISPDDNYFVYSTNFDTRRPISSAATSTSRRRWRAAAPTTLVSNTKGALFGLRAADNFTADSKYVLFIENVNTTAGIGDFYAALLPSGTPAMIATGQWQNWSATGDKVVYEDNCPSCSATAGKGTATADIEVVDVSTTNAPTKIQASVDVPLTPGVNGLFLSPAKDRIDSTRTARTRRRRRVHRRPVATASTPSPSPESASPGPPRDRTRRRHLPSPTLRGWSGGCRLPRGRDLHVTRVEDLARRGVLLDDVHDAGVRLADGGRRHPEARAIVRPHLVCE